MGQALLALLTPTVLAAALIGAVIFLSKNWILARLKASIQHDYDSRLETSKAKLTPYSQEQFRLYNDLWGRLCDLRESMERLWVEATPAGLDEFTDSLVATQDQLERSALVVVPGHYDELSEILNVFAEYRFGKQTLVQLRTHRHPSQARAYDIDRLIRSNGDTRDRLLAYLPQMKNCLRRQLADRTSGRVEQRHRADGVR